MEAVIHCSILAQIITTIEGLRGHGEFRVCENNQTSPQAGAGKSSLMSPSAKF